MEGTKNQQRLLKLLGSKYAIKAIDGEPCLYRKLNDHYDIEISNTQHLNNPINIYVWDISDEEQSRPRVIEKFYDIKGDENLQGLLAEIENKYKD